MTLDQINHELNEAEVQAKIADPHEQNALMYVLLHLGKAIVYAMLYIAKSVKERK